MMFYLYVIYYVIMNMIAFVTYGIDKKRAVNRKWRIPEIVLLGMAALGGCVGAYISMQVYRHKTRHYIFTMGVPAMILIHGCAAVILIEKGILALPL